MLGTTLNNQIILTESVIIWLFRMSLLRIYSPEKTLADCFKFRNQVGLDTVVEAVHFYRERRSIKVDDLMRYAGICCVKKIIHPYLEAIL